MPSAGRYLLDEFAAALAGWAWDAALLQEVPPWWPPELAIRAGADSRSVLTSRNALLPLRRTLATRWPDMMKSNGGGANAILVRRPAQIAEHRIARLCWLPERRWLHAVRLESGLWVGNLHTEARVDQGEQAARTIGRWARHAPIVLGGDFNVHDLRLRGFVHAAGHDADHIFAAGFERAADSEVLDRGRLSDHVPVAVTLVPKS